MDKFPGPLAALEEIARALEELTARYALVGGLAVSARAEVRFTRDVDVAVAVGDDAEAEAVVYRLKRSGFLPVTTVEQKKTKRLATARLESPNGTVVDLIFATSGIENEIVSRSQSVYLNPGLSVPVAQAEELLAMKVLSMSDERLQDRIDARNLVCLNPSLDLKRVKQNLSLITERGFARQQNLSEKLDRLLEETAGE
jgi:predicted nucleotidyltransferase